MASLLAQTVKPSAYDMRDPGSIPDSGRSPGEGNGNPLQYSCLENSMDGGSLVGYSPWGRKESDTTEQLHFHLVFLKHLFMGFPGGSVYGVAKESDTTLHLNNNFLHYENIQNHSSSKLSWVINISITTTKLSATML